MRGRRGAEPGESIEHIDFPVLGGATAPLVVTCISSPYDATKSMSGPTVSPTKAPGSAAYRAKPSYSAAFRRRFLSKESDERRSRAREATDESLREERGKADVELALRLGEAGTESDQLISAARLRADARLEASRRAMDEHAGGAGGLSPEQRQSLETQRREEDESIEEERAVEDLQRTTERATSFKAVHDLLSQERAATDRHLTLERKQVTEEIESQEAFFGMVSHDLSNLLGGISMSAATLMRRAREGASDEVTMAAAEHLRHFNARMTRLLGDLVDDVSIAAGKLSVLPVEGDLFEIVKEAAEVYVASAAAKEITLIVEPPTGPAVASFDRDRLLQVIANLLGNAMKFTPRGGRVELRVTREGEKLQVSVADTGIGIPPDKLSVIFERFWQAPHSKAGGLGLGLYIANAIVKAHGGAMWATSNGSEGGTTVHFTLPVAR